MPANVPEPSARELEELRELLVGQEIEELANVQARLSDPAKRAQDLAQVLPDAIKSAKAKNLRDALEPVVEKSFRSAIRKNPGEVVEAIYPIIGPSIRASIGKAIRDFAESLNQIVEKSVSIRAIRWRIESLITGKPFSEILLSRSLLYTVEQVFLIHRSSGVLLQNMAAQDSVVKDADMISGMLTAIRDFVSDSFVGGQDLETVDVGSYKLWLTYGTKVLLVGAVSGTAPVELKQVFRKALDGIEETLRPEIEGFKQGDTSVFEPAQFFLKQCLLGQSAPGKRKKARLWPYVLGLAAIIAVLLGYQYRQRAKWDRCFAELKQQEGIVITGIERHGSSYVISGLKDPAAPNPSGFVRARGLDPAKATFSLKPYYSINTNFARQRDRDAARQIIEGKLIRFDTNSSKVSAGEADHIDEVAESMKGLLPGAAFTITGRSDETGPPETNDKLSRERANVVADALHSVGIPASAIKIVAAGNTQPLRQGSSDWDLQANRSVSFTVHFTK
jgi:outer membrane protein OmpA-like peptidoglycan-associated protein